jgi:predicted ATP-grasp superfamily ATP-dependent carboligase
MAQRRSVEGANWGEVERSHAGQTPLKKRYTARCCVRLTQRCHLDAPGHRISPLSPGCYRPSQSGALIPRKAQARRYPKRVVLALLRRGTSTGPHGAVARTWRHRRPDAVWWHREGWQVGLKDMLAGTSLTRSAPLSDPAPERIDVMLLDAGSRQSLASVRSLGRAGLRVAAAECFAECDPRLPVLAFRSRYTADSVVLPNFATDRTAFAAGVLEFVRERRVRVVLPASDGAIAALLPVRDELLDTGAMLALPASPALQVANDKGRTLEVARSLGIDHPETMVLTDLAAVSRMLADFAFPIVLKPTSSWGGRSDTRMQAVEVLDAAEAWRAAEEFLAAGVGVLAQHWVGGVRQGVTLFVVDGEVRASFAHVEHRTTPALGGASVVRESTAMPDDIFDASVRLVTALGLQGLSEVEFRRDAEGRPLLMEINARLAGPVETALRSGVDFPLMVWQWATGERVESVHGYATGVRMRWLRGDMRWLRDNYRRVGRPDSMPRGRALLTFVSEFVRTRHYDCFDRHDLRPMLAELRTTAGAVRGRSNRPPSPTTDTTRTGTARAS